MLVATSGKKPSCIITGFKIKPDPMPKNPDAIPPKYDHLTSDFSFTRFSV